MTDKIIKDFDEFINELCGEDDTLIKKEKVKDHFRQLRDIEEFIKYRKELDRLLYGCHSDRYNCPCGEKYDVYLSAPKIKEKDWWTAPMSRISEVEYHRSHHFCMACGLIFYTVGEIKFIRNVNSKIRLEFTEGS